MPFMSSFTYFISLLFLIALFFSFQTYARESHFFSKVAPLNNNNNAKEAEVPNMEPDAFVTVTKHEQKPTFIPETENSYGLYGQESVQLPPSTTTRSENAAYKPEFEKETSKYTSNTNRYENRGANEANYYNSYFNGKDSYDANSNDMRNAQLSDNGFNSDNNNDHYYFHNNAYATNLKDLSNNKLTETSYDTMRNQKSNSNKYNYKNGADKFNMEREGMRETRFSNMNHARETGSGYEANLNDPNNSKFTETSYNSMRNQKNKYDYDNNAANKLRERQGMSDTRFLEGGKYYYDINSEKFNPTMYENSRELDTRNWYSDNKGYYANNQNMYDNNKSMYQNQEEFEDDQDEFQP